MSYHAVGEVDPFTLFSDTLKAAEEKLSEATTAAEKKQAELQIAEAKEQLARARGEEKSDLIKWGAAAALVAFLALRKK